jgi:hypothetical protein
MARHAGRDEMATSDLSHAVWRISSYSGTNGACVEVAVVPAWQTSTYSGQNGDCVEVARNVPGVVAVRDSKDRGGSALTFSPADWEMFTSRIRSGELG